jgi:YdjC-like protein
MPTSGGRGRSRARRRGVDESIDGTAGTRLLIVNADDYGLTEGVSKAILATARDGIVTSTSVLAVAPAFDRTSRWLAGTNLGVGAHFAAVGEDPPLLSAREVPTLVDERGAARHGANCCRGWRRVGSTPTISAGSSPRSSSASRVLG